MYDVGVGCGMTGIGFAAKVSGVGAGRTFLLVDGENIDATLGMSVLGHRPGAEERPRWDKVLEYAKTIWAQPVTALFFLNATSGQLPMGFIQALLAMGYRPIPLAGAEYEKVVDIGIQRTLAAISELGRGLEQPESGSATDGINRADVIVASHDGDYLPQISALLAGGHRVALLGFREFLNGSLAGLTDQGLRIHDLEHDVKAFTVPLPRVRAIPLEDFDPLPYLI